jgi:hypothetical protein
MDRRLALCTLIALGASLAGCASGPKFADVAQSIPTVAAGEGRIYFFRSSSMLGAAIQPDIRLNGEVVGASKPGGFFYVDRKPGTYVGSTTTETEKTLSFALAAGETKYVRSSPSFGVMVGRINLELEDAQKARDEIATLSYTGNPLAAKK